jgi:hypothetical protein
MSAPSSAKKPKRKMSAKKRNERQAHRRFLLLEEVDRIAEHFRNETEFRMEVGATSARCPSLDDYDNW